MIIITDERRIMGGSGGTASDLNELKNETGSSFSDDSPIVYCPENKFRSQFERKKYQIMQS
jgi:hypothetical protein